MGNLDFIKDSASEDPRVLLRGVICDILECNQYLGFGAILRVRPLNASYMFYSEESGDRNEFNVVCASTPGIYGFPASIKDMFFAYVMCDRVTNLDGRPAVLVPKTFLPQNTRINEPTEKDLIDKEVLENLIMRKESMIKSNKFS